MYKDIRQGRKKYTTSISTQYLYPIFIESRPEYKDMSYDQFKLIMNRILDKYSEMICTNPHGVRLPFYMGDIAIKYVQSRSNNNRGLHKKGMEGIEHLNLVTNGKQAKIVWSIEHAQKFNKYLKYIGFGIARPTKASAHEAIVDKPEIYKTNRITKKGRLAKKHINDK